MDKWKAQINQQTQMVPEHTKMFAWLRFTFTTINTLLDCDEQHNNSHYNASINGVCLDNYYHKFYQTVRVITV